MQLRALLSHLGPALRHGRRAVTSGVGLIALTGAPSPGQVTVAVTGLRSDKGLVLACLTARRSAFPDCRGDPAARELIVPAARSLTLNFGAVAPGEYAVAVIHDENSNHRLDKRLMLPREGFGFSRDAAVRFGPPSFSAAAFPVGAAGAEQSLRMRYML